MSGWNKPVSKPIKTSLSDSEDAWIETALRLNPPMKLGYVAPWIDHSNEQNALNPAIAMWRKRDAQARAQTKRRLSESCRRDYTRIVYKRICVLVLVLLGIGTFIYSMI
jgi:hypothetical protein